MAVIPSQGAQDWVKKKYGTIDNYTGMQQGKYDNALRSNDADMIARLKADALKVGYKLSTPIESSLNFGVKSDTPAVQSGPNPSDLIGGLYDASLQAQVQKLKSARDTQLAGLAGQDDLVKQSAYSNRNQADVVSMQNAQKLKEAMANMGLDKSGDNLTAMAQGNAQRQGALGDININESNQLKQLAALRDAINNSASQDEISAVSQNQADMMSAQLGQYNQDRSYGLQLGGMTGSINGVKTLDALRRDDSNNQWKSTFDYNKSVDQRDFSYQQARDKILDTRYKQEFDRDTQQFGLDYAIRKAQANNQISNSNADNSRQNTSASFGRLMDVWSATGKAPAGLENYGVRAGEPYQPEKAAKVEAQSADSMSKYFDGVVQRDKDGKVTNQTDVEMSILASGLPEYEMYRSYLRYGIPWSGPVPSPN